MNDDNLQPVIDAARAAIAPFESEGVTHFRVPEGWTLVTYSGEAGDETPDRPAGTTTVHDLNGFLARHQALDGGTSVIYANHESQHLVAVLNDDGADLPDWRDHRLVYAIRPTLSWRYWTSNEGLHEQEQFAQVIEDGLADITDPAGAVMLEVASTFEATIGARFRRAANLRDGARQLVYEETIDAAAGAAGEVTLPETFTLTIAPFEGMDPVEVTARIRFRLRDGNLAIGYTLPDSDRVAEAAFAAAVDTVRDQLPDTVVVLGVPPEPARPTRIGHYASNP